MKQMKKVLAIFFSFVMLAACLAFAGCESKEKTVLNTTLDESSASIVVITVTKTNEEKSLFDAMQAWKEEGALDFTYSTSEYGAYLLSVNGREPDAEKNEFWAIYTSLTTYKDTVYSSTEYGSYEYEGSTLGSASYGVSGLPLVEGCVYVLTIGTY